jgi:hypothetical protein
MPQNSGSSLYTGIRKSALFSPYFVHPSSAVFCGRYQNNRFAAYVKER